MAFASTASLAPVAWLLVFVGVVSWAVWRGTLSAGNPPQLFQSLIMLPNPIEGFPKDITYIRISIRSTTAHPGDQVFQVCRLRLIQRHFDQLNQRSTPMRGSGTTDFFKIRTCRGIVVRMPQRHSQIKRCIQVFAIAFEGWIFYEIKKQHTRVFITFQIIKNLCVYKTLFQIVSRTDIGR